MVQEKTRIKFRVSAADGVAASGLPAPRWTEKWGVSLFDYEEFHVTDQLLKLPFQETPPKTVCVFSLATGALRFKLLDSDRIAEVNGVRSREAIVGIGDRIRIGENLTIEVVLAPKADGERGPSVSNQTPKPLSASEMKTSLFAGSSPEEGPTLTLTSSGPVQAGQIFAEQSASIEIDEPSFKRPSAEPALDTSPAPSQTASPAVTRKSPFAIDGSSPNILATEPTLETVQPAAKPAATRNPQASAVPRPAKNILKPEPRVELANLPHAIRDDSLDSRAAGMAETADALDPVYPRNAKLDARPSFSEKILSAFSKVLRRDELTPPEALPSDQAGAKAPQPWIPAEHRDPGIQAMTAANYGSATTGGRPAQAWIPQSEPAGARMRGRALVFLVAAGGTLMIAVGVFRIYESFRREEAERAATTPVSFSELNRGVPVEVLEEKVRRMRRR